MRRRRTIPVLALAVLLGLSHVGCNLAAPDAAPRMSLFIGVDTSGSFHKSGFYKDSLSFLAYYIYGHLNELGGLEPPKELFVAAIGGTGLDEPKAFHPIHDFKGKSLEQIEGDLRKWYSASDKFTDYNAFFGQVERIVKERNLVLAPIEVMIVTDGIPDLTSRGSDSGSREAYEAIDLSGLEYLSRRTTLRLTYTSPLAGESWRRHVPRQRLRLWTVEAEVMKGWREQIEPSLAPAAQHRLWEWVIANVDYRIRA